MDVVGRMMLEDRAAAPVEDRAQRQRHVATSALVEGCRVLEVEPGDGMGTLELAASAAAVHALGHDAGAIDAGRARADAARTSFEVADPAATLADSEAL